MTSDVRVVVDTNVFISAILRAGSLPDQAARFGLSSCRLLVSHDLLRELEHVLTRPKFAPYVTVAIRRAILANLVQRSDVIQIVERISACRDPKDNMILELAVNGRAGCIVTGDADLLGLHPYRGIAIVTPAGFLARVAER